MKVGRPLSFPDTPCVYPNPCLPTQQTLIRKYRHYILRFNKPLPCYRSLTWLMHEKVLDRNPDFFSNESWFRKNLIGIFTRITPSINSATNVLDFVWLSVSLTINEAGNHIKITSNSNVTFSQALNIPWYLYNEFLAVWSQVLGLFLAYR